MSKKPLVLTILDGFGITDEIEGNAIYHAKTPNFDKLFTQYPNTLLNASSEFVGLPLGQMGNSEVGHLNIGAGEIVYTGLSLINNSIKNKTFFKNKEFLKLINYVKTNNKTLHLLGLLSDGGIHSHQDHLFALIELANQHNIKKLSIHVFLDGRDTPPNSSIKYLHKLKKIIHKYNYEIASISGRLYSMDRDQRFDKTQQAFDSLLGKCNNKFNDSIQYVKSQYQKNNFDEFVEPAINEKAFFVEQGDGLIFFNFRPDRARQLSHLLVDSNLYSYKSNKFIKDLKLIIMMPYEGIENVKVAFSSMEVKNPLGLVLSQNNFKQLRVSETQKYAHVTFFLDGGNDILFPNCKRIMVESLKVDNFASEPQMSAKQITDVILDNWNKYDVIICNYANADMVGHTGNFEKTIDAIEHLDEQVGRLLNKVEINDGTIFITADHGNAEIMLDDKNQPATKHTSSLVPFICTDKNIFFLPNGKLADVSPTILSYLNLELPNTYTGNNLIKK